MDQSGIYIMGSMYIFAGLMHFIKPKAYMKIMPKYIPYHLTMVYVSGICEMLFGTLLFSPQTQSIGAWGIIATLIAVFPANIYMLTSYKGKRLWYKIALWLRLPIQLLLISWAYQYV